MSSSSVERALMHGLAACLDGPVPRGEVTHAMRNTTANDRRKAAAMMITQGMVTIHVGEKGRRGPAPRIITITDHGRSEHARLVRQLPEREGTIWGDV